jgi:hypothetical protein
MIELEPTQFGYDLPGDETPTRAELKEELRQEEALLFEDTEGRDDEQ